MQRTTSYIATSSNAYSAHIVEAKVIFDVNEFECPLVTRNQCAGLKMEHYSAHRPPTIWNLLRGALLAS